MYVTLIWIWDFFYFFPHFFGGRVLWSLCFCLPTVEMTGSCHFWSVVLGVKHTVSCMPNKHWAHRAPSQSRIQAAAFYFLRHRFTVELRNPPASASGMLRLKTTRHWLELLAAWDLLLVGASPKSDMVPGTSQYSFRVWCRMSCWVCGVGYYIVSNSACLKLLNYTE